MAAKPFKEKELSLSEKGDKDKEVSKDKHEKEKHEKEKHEKEKHEKNETKENKENKEKQEKDKQEKEKHEKEQKEQKEAKEHKEQKDKSEKHEKQEKEKHEKELKDRKEIVKEHKEGGKEIEIHPSSQETVPGAPAAAGPDATIAKVFEKHLEKTLLKHEKHEIFEKFEKFEKHEKSEFELPGGFPVLPGDPLMEQRVVALESAMAQLMHFIPENLRPDLSQGALKQEPAAAAPPDEPAPSGVPAQPKEPDKKK
jgi:hypothetical protein